MKRDQEETVTPADAPSQDVGPKKTVEEWATAKGMLPQIFPGVEKSMPANLGGDRMGSIGVPLGRLAGPRANPKWWMFSAAKAGAQWPESKEVTEAEFDEAVHTAIHGHQLG